MIENPNELGIYHVSDREMAAGSTLGSPKAVAIVKATGALEKVYSSDAGKTVLGTVVVHHWDEQSGVRLHPEPGQFEIRPSRQEHHFELSNGAAVAERIVVLSTKPPGGEADPPVVYYGLEITNVNDDPVDVSSYAFMQLQGDLGTDLEVQFDRRRNAFVFWNRSTPNLVRIVGSRSHLKSFEVSHDEGKASSRHSPGSLCGDLAVAGSDPLGVFHWSNHLRSGQSVDLTLKIVFSTEGRERALAHFDESPDGSDAIAQTEKYYAEMLSRAVLITPDPQINRGVLWAKANMLRILLKAHTGWTFVNDPARSNNSVARDTAWFCMGADYVLPEFSRHALLWYIEHLEETGMVAEYYDIRNGKPADYRLNINDDTPLIVIALWHHYQATGDREFLNAVYPNALRAARHILSQRNDRGLVWCTAQGTADWGIVGWRNVIDSYRLSGATTELNSECYAALETVAHMAEILGKSDDVTEFREHAAALRGAINEHLLDKDRKLYYLTIDLDGTPRTDVTGDLVFPVMFGVSEDDVSAHIVNRLSVDEFWTGGGMRTVPRGSPMYSPVKGYGLLGGVWVNETIWFAMAASRFNPEIMAHALSTSFLYYSTDPRRNNTVPGQFSEWLHGETLVNQGMMLSPWFAPQYLWAAVEGVAGLNTSGPEPSVTPRLAPAWKWLGVRNLQFRNKHLSWFAVRQEELRMYANFSFAGTTACEVYEDDCTDSVAITGEPVAVLALRRGHDYAILLGNAHDHGVTVAVELSVECKSYDARIYNSLRGAWQQREVDRHQLEMGVPFSLDRNGFCVIELRRVA